MSSPRPLPPEDVLRRTIVNNALLDHVGMTGRVHVISQTFSGSFVFSGALEDAGASWWLMGSLLLRHTAPLESSYYSGSLVAVSLDHRTLGVRMDSAHGIIGDRLKTALVHSDTPPWLLISFSTGSIASLSPTATDDESIDAIMSALRITSSSIEKQSYGSYVYRISVLAGSGSSLVSQPVWKGDLVIDARTFELLSLHWTSENLLPSSSFVFDDIDLLFDPDLFVPKPQIEGSLVSLTSESLTDIILGKPLLP